jgi:hypothetical protein
MPSDDIGPDGTVRLRCYLPHADIHYFAATCPTCPRVLTIGVDAAIGLMGSAEATVGQLRARLLCRPCGGRVSLIIGADSRSLETQRREGRLPETLGVRIRE